MIAAIPVKPFGVAKARLSPVMDAVARSRLGRFIAWRTASTAASAGATVVIVTADAGVAAWARDLGHEVVMEHPRHGSGLNGAAAAGVARAGEAGVPWAILHADLPIVGIGDLTRAFADGRRGWVLAPSHDGGTNLIAGPGLDFPFSYGPGSFRRHLGAVPGARVVSRPGLALDLDTPRDLARALAIDAALLTEDSPAGVQPF